MIKAALFAYVDINIRSNKGKEEKRIELNEQIQERNEKVIEKKENENESQRENEKKKMKKKRNKGRDRRRKKMT